MDQKERWEDPQEGIQSALDGRQQQMWTAIPGIVAGRNGNNVSVNPSIQARLVNQKGVFSNVNLPQLINVPLVMPGGGGFGITFPVNPGDEVLVVFASRCIDGWWQNGGIQPQVEVRMHDLSDGFAFPAPMSNPKALGGISNDSAQIRNANGGAFIELGPSGAVNVHTGGNVTINAAGEVNIIAAGDVTITGNLKVTGEITAGSGTGDSVTLQQHQHGTGSAAAGTTVPTPGT
jgi:hypothetical protein